MEYFDRIIFIRDGRLDEERMEREGSGQGDGCPEKPGRG
jgi:hypothetical protein